MLLDTRNAERRADTAGGDHELVVAHLLAVVQANPMGARVDAHDVTTDEGDTRDGGSHGVGDVVLRQRARGHLIEQGAEELVGMSVDQHDLDPRRALECLRRVEAGEACPDDDDLHALHARIVPVGTGWCHQALAGGIRQRGRRDPPRVTKGPAPSTRRRGGGTPSRRHRSAARPPPGLQPPRRSLRSRAPR